MGAGGEEDDRHLLLLYHFLLGSTRCMKPSWEEEVAAGPTAIVSEDGGSGVGAGDELGEAKERRGWERMLYRARSGKRGR